MTEPRSPLDAALDLLVYVPVGLALTASEEIPKLAAKGRAQLGGRISMAKVVGQFVVAQGRKEVSRRFSAATAPGRAAPSPARTASAGAPATPTGAPAMRAPATAGSRAPATPTGAPATPTGAPAIGAPATAPPSAPEVTFEDLLASADRAEGKLDGPGESAPPEGSDATSAAGANGVGASPASDGLAIPGYDSLAASQVVQRLAGLAADELAAVGAYESSHRARRTILTRVRQLQER